MDEKLRCYLAELVGTFVLVLFGAGAVCGYYLPSDYRPEVAGIAMAEGFTLAVLLSAIFPVSRGCLNPAITLILWVFKRLDGQRTVVMILMQLVGAVLAGLVLRVLFSVDVLNDARLGTPHLKALLTAETVTVASLATGVAVEMVFTAFLTWAIFAALFDPRVPRLGGLLPGLAQTAIIVVGFHLTGGCANPARWFGPIVWEFTLPAGPGPAPLADHVVYWAGPIVGAFVGAFLYSAVLLPPDHVNGVPDHARSQSRRHSPPG
jgi:glycerol uptake facilitator-like aquaporin